jgi:hypothetical protein
MAKTVGQFTIDNGEFSGPAEYMLDKGDVRLNAILAGADPIFNATAHLSPDVETAILVAMQTDYAGWNGARQFMRAHGI